MATNARGGARPTVLVVDDEPTIRALVRATLSASYEVIEAANGAVALRIAAEVRPDAVLLDVALPGLSGLEVCHRLRTTLPGTQVLLITGVQPDVRAAAKAGAAGLIMKPFDPKALEQRLDAALSLPAAS